MTSDDSTSRPENTNTVAKTTATGTDNESKEGATLPALDDAAAIPKGTIDPVYEAKARALNHAVCTPQVPTRDRVLRPK